MDNLASKITDSELKIMKVLWKEDKLPISKIRKLLEYTNWEYSTIKTLLRRLCKKGVVKAIKKEVFYYSSLVSEKDYNNHTTQNLINNLYSGSAKNLIASLIESDKLNDEDIEELRTLLKVGDDENE